MDEAYLHKLYLLFRRPYVSIYPEVNDPRHEQVLRCIPTLHPSGLKRPLYLLATGFSIKIPIVSIL